MNSEWIYRGKIVNLKLDSYDSKKIEVVHTSGAVVIVAINQDEKILFVRQWRPSIGKITLELPAGMLEKNELPIHCAKRELQEETGYETQSITPLGGFYSTPGFCDEYIHLFLAKDLSFAPIKEIEDETIDFIFLSMQEVLELIGQGKIEDAKSIAGIMWLKCL